MTPELRDRLRLRRVLRPEVDGSWRLQTDGRPLRDLLAVLDEPEVAALPIVAFVADKTLNAKTVGELAASPHLARFRALRLVGVKLGDEGFAALFGSPHGAGLRELCLHSTGIGDEGLAAIGRAPLSLETLVLDEGKLSDGAISAYLRTPAAASLRSLSSYRKVSPDLLRAISESPALADLESLELHEAGLATTALAPLASASFSKLGALGLARSPIAPTFFSTLDRAPFASTLRSLCLAGTRIDDGGLARLAAATRLALTSLDLHRSDVHGSGLSSLAAAPHLAGLTELSLGGSRSVKAKGDQAAAALGAWESLVDVTLDDCSLGDAGAAALASLPSLRTLRISGACLTAQGAAALGASASSKQLEVLDLGGYPGDPTIGPQGAAHLARGGFPALRELVLSKQRIGDAGVEAVARAFPSLRKLDVADCRLGAAAIDALATATFRATLEDLDLSFNAVGSHVAALGAGLPRLRALDLADTKSTNAAVVGLLASAPETLEDVDLDYCDLGAAAVDALVARAGQLANISGSLPKASKEKKAELVAALKPPPAGKAAKTNKPQSRPAARTTTKR